MSQQKTPVRRLPSVQRSSTVIFSIGGKRYVIEVFAAIRELAPAPAEIIPINTAQRVTAKEAERRRPAS